MILGEQGVDNDDYVNNIIDSVDDYYNVDNENDEANDSGLIDDDRVKEIYNNVIGSEREIAFVV